MESAAMKAGAKCLVCLLVVGAVIYVTAGPVTNQTDDITARSSAHSSEVSPSSNVTSEVGVGGDKPVLVDVEVVSESSLEETADSTVEGGDRKSEEIEEGGENTLDELVPDSEDVDSLPVETSDVTELPAEVEDKSEETTVDSQEKRKKKQKKHLKRRKGKKKKKTAQMLVEKLLDDSVDLMNEIEESDNEDDLMTEFPPSDNTTDDDEIAELPPSDNFTDVMQSDMVSGRRLVSNLDISPIRNYLKTCANSVSTPSCYDEMSKKNNLCDMHDPALEMRKWALELESVLSHGCCCRGKENCGDQEKCCGSCCLRREEPFESTVVRITQMLKNLFHDIQGNCQCGPEDVPQPCPWTDWTPCSQTCGQGVTRRYKTCDPTQVDSKTCMDRPCPSSCGWQSWGSWSRCSQTCGQGTVSRTRECRYDDGRLCRPRKCGGDVKESKVIECGPPFGDAIVHPWSSWTPCSKTCGYGIKTRSRRCEASPCGRQCPLLLNEQMQCGTPDQSMTP